MKRQISNRRAPTFYAMTGENGLTTMLVVGNNRGEVEDAARRLITEGGTPAGNWPSLRAVTHDRNLTVLSYTQLCRHLDDETIFRLQYEAISSSDY